MKNIDEITLNIKCSELLNQDLISMKLFAGNLKYDISLQTFKEELVKKSLSDNRFNILIPYIGKYLDIKLARQFFKISYLKYFPSDYRFLGLFNDNGIFFHEQPRRNGFHHLIIFSSKNSNPNNEEFAKYPF